MTESNLKTALKKTDMVCFTPSLAIFNKSKQKFLAKDLDNLKGIIKG